jgi:phosphoenolpyruvate---glycerone phosphotransferase subunit DhaL
MLQIRYSLSGKESRNRESAFPSRQGTKSSACRTERNGTSTYKAEVDIEDLVQMFEAAEKGIQEMGKAQIGDKILLDTLDPSMKALKEARPQGKSLVDALADFAEAARKGTESTRKMISKIGRSSRLGERTLGRQDAGATSCYLILSAFYQGI